MLDLTCDQLLATGGDSRLLPGTDGLNRYGCRFTPRDAMALGSCTCSSPSPRGMEAATTGLDLLRQATHPEQLARRMWQNHRLRLREQLKLPASVDVAFGPSGTDVELLVLALVAAREHRRIVNIVVGPTEVGTGTVWSAAGLHSDYLLPSGQQVTPQTPVCEQLAERVSVQTVAIRDGQGELLNEFYLDALVTEMVAEAVAQEAHVILHLVAHSKTGIHLPSARCVDRICQRLPMEVSVVIDAAQGRISRRRLQESLSRGQLVMFTGSKFYGGPPFSGALFIPPQWQSIGQTMTALPDGFEQYFTTSELPENWTRHHHNQTDWENYGALLRWESALAEIEAYYRIPSTTRLAIMQAFETTVPALLQKSPFIQLLPSFPPAVADAEPPRLESQTTVFSFRIIIYGHALNRSDLEGFHRELNQDVRDQFGDFTSEDLSRRFHIGQPVPLEDGSAALRVALGADLIVRLASDSALGNTFEARLGWLGTQLESLRRKIDMLAEQRSMKCSLKRSEKLSSVEMKWH